MATRTIRTIGDDVLTKVCKEVKEVTPKTKELIDDMFETMYDAMGVGLAANQVGMLKRIVVIDCGDDPHVLINPVIIETAGEQRGYEGCLSVPGKTGVVTRPDYAKVKAYDEDMNESGPCHLSRMRTSGWAYVCRKSRGRIRRCRSL